MATQIAFHEVQDQHREGKTFYGGSNLTHDYVAVHQGGAYWLVCFTCKFQANWPTEEAATEGANLHFDGSLV